jgi:transcription elongation GreA/GreB family factor
LCWRFFYEHSLMYIASSRKDRMSYNKQEIIEILIEKSQNRINDINAAKETAQDAILNDTKSSMGDKYETSREMAQQELNRLQTQLQQAQADLDKLKTLNVKPTSIVSVGSIVITNQFDYFIAISVGPVKINDKSLMVISKESPIGSLLIGNKTGGKVTFNGKDLMIKNIL